MELSKGGQFTTEVKLTVFFSICAFSRHLAAMVAAFTFLKRSLNVRLLTHTIDAGEYTRSNYAFELCTRLSINIGAFRSRSISLNEPAI